MIDIFKSVFKNTNSDNLCLIECYNEKMKLYTFDQLCDHHQKKEGVTLLGYFATGIYCDVSTITENYLVLPLDLVHQVSHEFDLLCELAVAWDEHRRLNQLNYN